MFYRICGNLEFIPIITGGYIYEKDELIGLGILYTDLGTGFMYIIVNEQTPPSFIVHKLSKPQHYDNLVKVKQRALTMVKFMYYKICDKLDTFPVINGGYSCERTELIKLGMLYIKPHTNEYYVVVSEQGPPSFIIYKLTKPQYHHDLLRVNS